MNSLVALPIAAAVPTVAPQIDAAVATPAVSPSLPAGDLELISLADQLIAAATESRRLYALVEDIRVRDLPEWDTAREKKSRAYRKAKTAYDKAERIETSLEERIHSIPATMIAGMTAKARCAELYDFESGVRGCFMESIAKDLLALNAEAPATIRSVSTPLAAVCSPAIEAVERYRKASKQFNRCSSRLSDARDAAVAEHGRETYPMIHWRNYWIGGSEIARTRDSFLGGGEDPATIEEEYRDAKKRYRAQVKASKEWEKQVGIDGLVKSVEQARAKLQDAEKALGNVQLRSIVDASALLELVRLNVRYGDIQNWEIAAFDNASKFLKLAVTDNAAA